MRPGNGQADPFWSNVYAVQRERSTGQSEWRATEHWRRGANGRRERPGSLKTMQCRVGEEKVRRRRRQVGDGLRRVLRATAASRQVGGLGWVGVATGEGATEAEERAGDGRWSEVVLSCAGRRALIRCVVFCCVFLRSCESTEPSEALCFAHVYVMWLCSQW